MSTTNSSKAAQDANSNFVERQKSRWVPDALSTSCARCGAQWTVFRRKHHCRRCCQVFCDPCCANKVVLPGYGTEPQRVCKICEAILAGSTATMSINAEGKIVQVQPSASSPAGSPLMPASSSSSASASRPPRDGKSQQGGAAAAGTTALDGSNAKPFPSLECFPRERRVLLVGSAGVGKGSFVATACGSNNSPFMTTAVNQASSAPGAAAQQPQQQQQHHHHNAMSSDADPHPGSAAGGGGGGASAPTERRRLYPFQGQVYSLTLVNTAGSTVSSDLFVHPLLTIGTSAYILMYDVTEPKSFELLPLLYERLLDCGAGDKAVLLVGSKADHVSQTGAGRDRVVSKDAAQRLARQWGAPHVDCACNSKESVDHALLELLREISTRDTF